MERKLATIRQISDIQPIEGADNIEVATVDGWHVVCKKGEFKIGDHCIYCEIDSVMPDRPEFAFLKDSNGRMKRIRTVKLRGQLSQGICFSLDILSSVVENFAYSITELGQDVTELLGITKYEPYISATLGGVPRGTFPTHLLPKSDEERIQNLKKEMRSWNGIEFVMTEKLDGTSATFILNEDEFMVCSRNQWLKEDETNVYWRIAKELDIEKKMRELCDIIGDFAIQGEIVGPGIQSNRLKLDKLSFFVFNIYSIAYKKYLSWQNIEEFNKDLGLQLVPILGTGFVLSEDMSIDSLIAMADGTSLLNQKVLREGLVYRSYYGCPDEIYGKVSFKIVSNKYLLKTGE